MTTPTLTTPPLAPTVADPATFDARADAHLIWQATNVSEMGVALAWVDTKTDEVLANKNLTDTARDAAQAAATLATDKSIIATDKATLATDKANEAAASAASALNAPGTRATSTTSLNIGTGIKTLTIQTGKLFSEGQMAVFADTTGPNLRQMYGAITAHNNVTGSISIDVLAGQTVGSGTVSTWTVSLTGARGPQGASAGTTRDVRTTDVPLNLADIGKLVERTSGTVQSLELASAIGANWDTYIKNSTGVNLTIDPAGSDLIAGLGSYVLAPKHTLHLQCDGLTFTVISDSVRIERLHALSAEASTKYALSSGMPIFDGLGAMSSGAVDRVMWATNHFLAIDTSSSTTVRTSPTGAVWTTRATGVTQQLYARNNGLNVVATYSTNPMQCIKSADGGLTWAAGTTATGAAFSFPVRMAYTTGGVCLVCSNSGTSAVVTTNNAGSWSAVQTMPHTATNVFAAGSNIVSYNNASATYYISTNGLTGGWTAKTLPDGITAGTIWEDGAGGLVLIPTDTAKNYWRTLDGDTWVDLGFNKASYTYAGLSANSVNFQGCPQYVNGNWVTFNQAAANSAGMGAIVKYAGNTWVPVLFDLGSVFWNTSQYIKLTATNGAGVTIFARNDGNPTNLIVNTSSDKCMAHFV